MLEIAWPDHQPLQTASVARPVLPGGKDGGSNELEGARNAGMTTIMITGIIRELWPDRIADRRRHADFVIEQLTELTA